MRVARELGAEYIVWENVPGVLSSNGGRDFAKILSEFTGWTIEPQKFGGVGCVRARGEGDFGVFYRILDSRFFGVPQRRRRIYLVARLGGLCRPEILFEPDSLRGHSSAGAAQGQDVAAFANTGIGVYNSSRDAATLRVGGEAKGGGSTLVISESSPIARADVPTLTASLSHHYNKQTPLLFENHAHDGRVEQKPHSPTLTTHCGTGGGNLPLVLDSDAVCIAENIIGRQDHNGGNGVGAQQGVSYTLNTVGVHGVADGFGVRRLTPRECERLQGFPDDWTRIPYRGKTRRILPRRAALQSLRERRNRQRRPMGARKARPLCLKPPTTSSATDCSPKRASSTRSRPRRASTKSPKSSPARSSSNTAKIE